MTKHTCMRCGLETCCSHASWPDRHPFAAVLFALPATLFGLCLIAAYPWLFVPLLVVAVAGYVVDREHRRRAALAARADHEHAALMARPLPLLPAPPVRPARPANPAPWHALTLLPTEPLRMGN